MDKAKLFLKLKRERSQQSAISPIIATLLLILIAIGAGVLVYAYVVGFIGNTTTNPGNNTSLISIDNFCASNSGKCNGNLAYSIVVRNAGSNPIPACTGCVQLYFTDITSGATGSTTCNIPATSPGSTYTCSSTNGTWPAGTTQPATGDKLTVKVVNSDGGTTSTTTTVIA